MLLLDINVLIALVDEAHTHHRRVTDWFLPRQREGWATCPIVENGFVRIVAHPKYPGGPLSTEAARALLANLCQAAGHQFWTDSISIRERQLSGELPLSKHLTDHYLLMLAVEHRARFATLDQRIHPQAIPGGAAALALIP